MVAHAVQEVVDAAGAGLLPAALGQTLPGSGRGAEQEQEQEAGSSLELPEQQAALVQPAHSSDQQPDMGALTSTPAMPQQNTAMGNTVPLSPSATGCQGQCPHHCVPSSIPRRAEPSEWLLAMVGEPWGVIATHLGLPKEPARPSCSSRPPVPHPKFQPIPMSCSVLAPPWRWAPPSFQGLQAAERCWGMSHRAAESAVPCAADTAL